MTRFSVGSTAGVRPGLERWVVALGLILVCIGQTAAAESPVSREWKQRLTDSLRRKIVQSGEGMTVGAVRPATHEEVPLSSAATEETIPLLSSLTGLLTQAATETLTFSREMRPTLEWPGQLWNARETEGWSWRRRLQWFQSRESESAETPLDSATKVAPASNEEGPR